MKILFDQGTPVPLRRHLPEHTVATAYEQGWSNLANGALLSAAERDGYELLITTDQNLRYQQNLDGRQIAILVLTSTSWPRIQQQLPRVFANVKGLSRKVRDRVPAGRLVINEYGFSKP